MRVFVRLLKIQLVTFSLLAAGSVALFWAPDKSVSELAPKWAAPPSFFVEVQGMRVHLRDEGPADAETTLLLLHGTSASLHTWDGWAASLSGKRRVIRADMPGFGLTGPHPEGDYTLGAYVAFVLGLLDALSVDEVVIAGNSFGGYVAWEVALAAPSRVRGLVLVDASGYPFEPEERPLGFRLAQSEWLRPVATRLLPRAVIASSVKNVYGDPSRVSEALIDRYYEITLREGNRASLYERFRQGTPDPRASERLATLGVPTLILWGGRDKLIPLENGHRFARDIPGARLVIFDELGHVPQEEDPEATVSALEVFLKR